jgi:CHAT domain-containing protein
VWVYDDRGIYPHWISTPPAVVEAEADQFLRLCSDPASDLTILRKKASELYNVLLLPIQGKLAPDRLLVFDPDGFLKKIPWVALVDPEERYLVERTSVILMPSLYRAVRLRTPLNILSDAAALIVDVPTIPDSGLAPLVDAESEAQTVAERFPSARRLQGSAATLPAIKKEIEVASVFHFVGHAVDTPQGHGLALAEKDLRTGRPRVIERLETKETENLQLAVLSACQTAAESNIGSSGTESLTESLIRGGVPRIVAARWNINSAQTIRLMDSFYAHLLNGNGAASAMRYASLAVAAQAQYAHPYYWAAFELVGPV